MRDSSIALLACVFSLSLTVRADIPAFPFWSTPAKSPPSEGGVDSAASSLGTFSATIRSSTGSISSIVSSTTNTQSPSPISSTTVTTIDVSSLKSIDTSIPSTLRAESTSVSSLVSPPIMSSSAMGSAGNTSSRQTLVIALATVLTVVTLILAGAILFLWSRYRKGNRPFGHRGASPINDDEIASWRRTAQEQKEQINSPTYGATRQLSPILPVHSPAWTWAASPSSIRTVSAHYSDPHAVLAQAPNARLGLTDEAVPGADPFITPPKRQNSRLSKAPPGHARTKSRRSSFSGKSLWGHDRTSSDMKVQEATSTWYATDDSTTISSHIRSTENGSSSPGQSTYDGHSAGGLSPRPIPRTRTWEQIPPQEIGRAIA